MTGYIILGVFLATVVFGGLAYLIYFLKNRNAWKWPEGIRTQATFNGFTVHMIYDAAAQSAFKHSVAETALRCAKAVDCLAQVVGDKSKFVPREYCIQVLGDVNYNKTIDVPLGTRSNGITLKLEAKAGGKTLPLSVCRSKGFELTESSGELVIHECIHVFIENSGDASGDPLHANVAYWGYPDGLEGKATALFTKKYGST